jgi:threonine dehydratase
VLSGLRFGFLEMNRVVAPGGAEALAALLAGKIDLIGKTAAVVLSGGNVDPDIYARAMSD